ncbi:lysosomal alpha-glucosidase-like [Argiope bruennichi]|uniref:lysosomal alpha-glucosidase-like n=1 Tax=Argiope bruennichi TaxID=94029 RepID=UPI0024949BA5|nr:lysosomal alpha-glucosidase-like [Argiope bruennichi]
MKMKSEVDDDLILLIPERNQRRYVPILWILVVIGFGLCFLSLAFWHHGCIEIQFNEIFVGKSHFSPVCAGISDLDKFDCHPDDYASELNCLQRGCCYQAKNNNTKFPPLNVPYCFYPPNYDGYKLQNIKKDSRHITAELKRSSSSGFPNDILSLYLVITFIDDNVLRIKITDPNAARFEVPIPINDGLKQFTAPNYDVAIDSQTGQLTITRNSSQVVIFKTNLAQMVYSDQFLQLSSYLPSPYIYGIGEHYGSFLRNVNWTRFTLLNTDKEPTANYPLYGSQPFYLSLEEDGNANGVFLFNSNAMDVILQPTPAITFRPIGGIFDFFVLLGPSPANVIQQYTNIVGRPFMPPYWSLGFHLCRYGYSSVNQTRETMQRNLKAGIPLDVQWNDIDYMDKFKDFTYDKDKFANLPEFVEELHSKGMHYVVITDPGISSSEKPGTYPPFDDGVKADIFLKNPNGSLFIGKVWTDGGTVFPDFSHPNATDYWSKQITDFHSQVQVDGLWIDMNEPSNVIDGGVDGCIKSSFEDPPYLPGGNNPLRHRTACMTSKHYKTIHYNEHNLMGYREAAATNLALKKIRQKRPFVISRATFLGQGAHSGHWSGDISSTWEDMRYSIPSILNFNLYGVPMVGSDICGFNFNTTVPLCARWQSLGAFYPFSRNHNDASAVDQDPAILGPTVVAAAVKSLQVRYMLLPYLYTLFARSHIYGDTVARPLFFEYPQDKTTYSIDEQFFLGPAFMVIPVLYEGAENVTAYIPKGKWCDTTGKLFNSTGEKISMQVSLTDIVTVYRGGYILPLQLPANNTAFSRKNAFVLMCTLDENFQAKGELYWDDGDSLDTYTDGKYNLIEFSIKNNTLTSSVVKKGYNDSMNLNMIQITGTNKRPTTVSLNGVNCTEKSVVTNQQASLFSPRKMPEFLEENARKADFCLYMSSDIGFMVVINTIHLLSPFNIVWN